MESNKSDQVSTYFNSKQLQDIPDYLSKEAATAEKKLGKFIYDQPPSQIEESLISRGPIELENGAVYIGQWSPGGYRHGKGVQLQPYGSKYEGYWENDQWTGQGRLITLDGQVYQGQFLNCLFHGRGMYIGNNHRYEGEWCRIKSMGLGNWWRRMGRYMRGSFLWG